MENLTKLTRGEGVWSCTDVSMCQNFILKNYHEFGVRATHSIFIPTPLHFAGFQTT